MLNDNRVPVQCVNQSSRLAGGSTVFRSDINAISLGIAPVFTADVTDFARTVALSSQERTSRDGEGGVSLKPEPRSFGQRL